MSAHRVLLSLALVTLAFACLPAEKPAGRIAVKTLQQIGTDTLRHGGPVRAIVYGPHGKTIFSAAGDGTVCRWDVASGKEQARFVGAIGLVRALALSPDGKTLVAGGSDKVVRLYDAQAKGEGSIEVVAQKFFTPRDSAIDSLAFHPSGDSFVVGLEEGKWLRYETATTRELDSREVGEPIGALSFLAAGKQVLTPRAEGGLILWSIANPRRIQDFEGETPSALAATPDGSRVAVGDFAGGLRLLKMPEGEVVWRKSLPAGPRRRSEVPAIICTPDGKNVLTAGLDGVVRAWDVVTGKEGEPFVGPRGALLALAISPDGKELVSGGDDGLLQRWDIATRKPIGGTMAAEQRVRAMNLRADRLALVVGGRLQVRAEDNLREARLPEALARRTDVRTALLHGDAMLVQSHDGQVLRIEGEKEPVEVLSVSARAVHFDLRGDTLAALTTDRQLLLVDLTGKAKEPAQISLDGDIGTAVALSPDGKHVAVVATSAIVRVWEVATGRLLHELPGALGGGTAVTFSPDGRLVASAGRDRLVRVIEVTTGTTRLELPVGPGYPTSVAFAADGKFLAAGASNGRVTLFDALRGVLLDQLDGHRGAVTALAFQKSNALLSVGNEGVLYQRDVGPILKANRPQALALSRQQMEEAWAQLGHDDARSVAVGIQSLVRAEAETMPWLKARLRPIEASRIQQVFKDLNADDFEPRDQAMRELGRMGKAIEGALKSQRELPKATLDYRVRIEELLDRITMNKTTPEYLQALRGIEVLERIASPEARQLLETLAGGLAEADVTRQAKAALERLRK